CFLQRLHWKTLRVFSSQKPRWPQFGQVRPSRQRISNSALRHPSSLPNRSRNSASLSPPSERRNPSVAATPPPFPPGKPRKTAETLAQLRMAVRDNQVPFWPRLLHQYSAPR